MVERPAHQMLQVGAIHAAELVKIVDDVRSRQAEASERRRELRVGIVDQRGAIECIA